MNINVDFNKIFQSKALKITVLALGAFIVLLLVFQAGMTTGFRKANFSFRWAENYHKNFAGPRAGFFGNFEQELRGRDFVNNHGVFGQIIKIDSSTDSEQATLVIRGADNVERIILLKDDTVIRRFQENIKSGDLKIDDQIVVIGSPNNSGQIEAKLIRIMPPAGGLPSGQFPMMRSR